MRGACSGPAPSTARRSTTDAPGPRSTCRTGPSPTRSTTFWPRPTAPCGSPPPAWPACTTAAGPCSEPRRACRPGRFSAWPRRGTARARCSGRGRSRGWPVGPASPGSWWTRRSFPAGASPLCSPPGRTRAPSSGPEPTAAPRAVSRTGAGRCFRRRAAAPRPCRSRLCWRRGRPGDPSSGRPRTAAVWRGTTAPGGRWRKACRAPVCSASRSWTPAPGARSGPAPPRGWRAGPARDGRSTARKTRACRRTMSCACSSPTAAAGLSSGPAWSPRAWRCSTPPDGGSSITAARACRARRSSVWRRPGLPSIRPTGSRRRTGGWPDGRPGSGPSFSTGPPLPTPRSISSCLREDRRGLPSGWGPPSASSDGKRESGRPSAPGPPACRTRKCSRCSRAGRPAAPSSGWAPAPGSDAVPRGGARCSPRRIHLSPTARSTLSWRPARPRDRCSGSEPATAAWRAGAAPTGRSTTPGPRRCPTTGSTASARHVPDRAASSGSPPTAASPASTSPAARPARANGWC
jgi:hypothetical protein